MLGLLLSRAGELVERQALHQILWPSDTFVEFDLGLNHCVTRLRAALGDDPKSARFIETVPKRGYRFVAPVRVLRRPALPGVAVLPFENLNGLAEYDYLAGSVTDALIDALARLPDLRVSSRRAVQPLRGTGEPLSSIARLLEVEAVVEGSTLRVGRRARGAVRLVQVEPERRLWSDAYEGSLDVLTWLDDVTKKYARAIQQALAAPASPPAPTAGSFPAITS